MSIQLTDSSSIEFRQRSWTINGVNISRININRISVFPCRSRPCMYLDGLQSVRSSPGHHQRKTNAKPTTSRSSKGHGNWLWPLNNNSKKLTMTQMVNVCRAYLADRTSSCLIPGFPPSSHRPDFALLMFRWKLVHRRAYTCVHFVLHKQTNKHTRSRSRSGHFSHSNIPRCV